jgi:glutathione synthase/RimK-type ligase-like ATP-grasp enzyme
MPPTLRYPRGALSTPAGGRDIALEFPVLLRPAGTHGGEDLELIAEPDEIAPLVARSAHAAFYVTGFVDYRSPDGLFRKYRLIFVGDQILPYHLAIADAWKVHYYRTEMVRHAWMRQEEETFLRDPAAVFDSVHFEALNAIRAAVDLEFFGIDCGLDRDGRLVVFEVNASMLVHANDPEPEFAYKQAPVARIKRAFDAMLAAAAGRA